MFAIKERLLEMCDDSYNDSYALPEKKEVDPWSYQHFLELKKIYVD